MLTDTRVRSAKPKERPLKLTDTRPPPAGMPGFWGYTAISAADVVRIYRHLLDPAHRRFGDFIMGFPAAVENTCAALAAGATAIGNLGQYFTFRLPNWDDDVATTTATVTALALLAAQEEEVLVHSNLDDGFAAGSAFGATGTPSAVLVDERGRIASPVAVGAPEVLALVGADRTAAPTP